MIDKHGELWISRADLVLLLGDAIVVSFMIVITRNMTQVKSARRDNKYVCKGQLHNRLMPVKHWLVDEILTSIDSVAHRESVWQLNKDFIVEQLNEFKRKSSVNN